MASATLAGIALGDPGSGFLVGALLEGLYLGRVPAGGARLPEPGPAAVVAAFAYASTPGPGGLALALAVGVTGGAIGGFTVIAQRIANGAVTGSVAGSAPQRAGLARAHWLCIGIDTVRGMALTAGGLLLVRAMPEGWAAAWPLGMATTVWLFALPSAATVGALLRDWIRSPSRVWLFVFGCLGGLVLALLA